MSHVQCFDIKSMMFEKHLGSQERGAIHNCLAIAMV